jgi:hypothetical protein
MIKPAISKSVLLILLALVTLPGFSLKNNSLKKEVQLNDDLSKVWPFSQTVKVEYDLVLAQLEIMENDSLKNEFLIHYEKYIEDTYLNQLVRLNIRQGKLLLLLIHRELGKTPYELLLSFRNKDRADFWQKLASFLGADLKAKYDPTVYPEIEAIVLHLTEIKNQEFISPKIER